VGEIINCPDLRCKDELPAPDFEGFPPEEELFEIIVELLPFELKFLDCLI
jgi:hypothetical protein